MEAADGQRRAERTAAVNGCGVIFIAEFGDRPDQDRLERCTRWPCDEHTRQLNWVRDAGHLLEYTFAGPPVRAAAAGAGRPGGAAVTGQALVAQADAIRLPLRDESVDLVVTSPPFWSLRSYDAGPGEIGSEPTPAEYLEALWVATAEMVRVLKPTGSILVDLGDKYAERGGPERDAYADGGQAVYRAARPRRKGERETGIRQKSLMLLPERYRIGCVDQLGLIARAVIVWDKPNGLPESVTDRVRRSHEDWVHLTRFPRYYAALDEIRVPSAPQNGLAGTFKRAKSSHDLVPGQSARQQREDRPDVPAYHPLGALPGSVWRIPSEPLRLPEWLGVQHYAAFASEWPRRLVLAFSPPGICLECGEGRWPVVDRRFELQPDVSIERNRDKGKLDASNRWGTSGGRGSTETTILGYACRCTPFTDHPGTGGDLNPDRADGAGRHNFPTLKELDGRRGPWREYHLAGWQAPPTRPAVVLDCFSGVGTTIGVARQLGRIGIGIDLSFPYCRAAKWRVFESGQFGKAIARTWAERQGLLL